PYIRNNVKSLGYRHKQMNLDIRSEELEAWQESLLYTVKKYDPFYNEQIDAAWRATLQVGIEIMQTECT
ncbi:globin, partial [Vibrio sp. FNV 38]|nr:globin [Vibrio sp. FNV 38]